MSATTDLRSFIAGKAGQTFTTAQLAEHCEANINSIYAALSKMAINGELVRVDSGKYQVPDGVPPATERETTDSDDAVIVAPPRKALAPKTRPSIEVGGFSSGRLVIARGATVLELDAGEAELVGQFLARWRT